MCGRFTYLYQWRQLHRLMQLGLWPSDELTPRYNVAPMEDIPAIRFEPEDGRVGVMLRWGLVPSWAGDPDSSKPHFFARGETASELPTFRSAFARRRCLIPMSGFYEWQAPSDSSTDEPCLFGASDTDVPKTLRQRTRAKNKQPYLFSLPNFEPFCVAGIWERWTNGERSLESVALVMTDANAVVRPVHDRMVVVLDPADYEQWLDPDASVSGVQQLIRPAPESLLISKPVSPRVGNPRNDDPSLIESLK